MNGMVLDTWFRPLLYLRWSNEKCIDAFMYPPFLLIKSQFLPSFVRSSPQVQVICVGQWRETDTELFDVRTAQWMDPNKSREIQVLDVISMIFVKLVEAKVCVHH